jgi:hypothetical protein
MKMMECIEDEVPTHPKGETRNKVIEKNQVDPSNGSKGCSKHKWNQGKLGLQTTRKSQQAKSHRLKRQSETCPKSNFSSVTTTDIWQRTTPSHLK